MTLYRSTGQFHVALSEDRHPNGLWATQVGMARWLDGSTRYAREFEGLAFTTNEASEDGDGSRRRYRAAKRQGLEQGDEQHDEPRTT